MVNIYSDKNTDFVAKKLNLLAKKLSLYEKTEFFEVTTNTNFQSEYFLSVAKKAQEITPFAKVAVFCTENDYDAFADKAYKALKGQGLRPTVFVAEKRSGVSLDGVACYFSLAEDVRLAVVSDSCLIDKVTYFCTLKNIPLILCIRSFNYFSPLLHKICIDTGSSCDEYTVDCKRYIAFDCSNILLDDKANAVHAIGAKSMAVIDYKINCVLNLCVENPLITQVLQSVLENTANALNGRYNDYDLCRLLLFGIFSLDLVFLYDSGLISEFYFARQVSRIMNGGQYYDVNAEYFAVKKALRLWRFDSCDNDVAYYSIDYVSLAENIAKATKRQFKYVADNILGKIKILNERGGKKVLLNALKPTYEQLCSQFSIIDKYYCGLGGKKTYAEKSIEKALELSGYMLGINLFTLFVEIGIIKI